MSWMFNDPSWLPYDDGSKFGPVTKEYLKYSLAIVRNSIDPSNTNFFHRALSSAVKPPGKASGSGSASAGSRRHKKSAQVNAALLTASPAVAAPAPTLPVVATGAGAGGAAADGVTMTSLLARLEHLEARDQRNQQQLEQQRVEHLEKELAFHRRLDEQRLEEQKARRAFTAAQGSHSGDAHGTSLSLVPHPNYNRGGGGGANF
jgi:hypothetical protein